MLKAKAPLSEGLMPNARLEPRVPLAPLFPDPEAGIPGNLGAELSRNWVSDYPERPQQANLVMLLRPKQKKPRDSVRLLSR